jgi:hypothetical protein
VIHGFARLTKRLRFSGAEAEVLPSFQTLNTLAVWIANVILLWKNLKVSLVSVLTE